MMLLTKSWKKYWRKFNLFIVFGFLLSVIVLFFFIGIKYFTINDVEIRGMGTMIGIDYLKNKNILLLSGDTVKKYILQRNPRLQDVEVVKSYPRKIVILAKLEKPIAQLVVKKGFYDLSYSGKILKKSEKRDFSLIVLNLYQKYEYNQYRVGDIFKNIDLQYCLFFIDKFKDLGLEADSVDINSSNMIIFNDDQTTYVLSTGREKWKQSEDLKRIIQRSKISGTKYTSIDLRFDKPIVKF